jgi:type III pantothenate kinase
MRSVVFDIGNTAVKAGFFDEAHRLVAVHRSEDIRTLAAEVADFKPTRALVASVAQPAAEAAAQLPLPPATVLFGPHLALPITVDYATPQTLGADRVAAAAGAARLFPGLPILILDVGTCLKADVLTADGTFRGGSISPGLLMRYRALHTFTGRLPLLAPAAPLDGPAWPADSTDASMRAGVEVGFLAEALAFVEWANARWPGIRPILTGGDGPWLSARLAGPDGRTFAVEPDLVLHGLYHILLHTA